MVDDPEQNSVVESLRAAGCVFAEEEAGILFEAAGGVPGVGSGGALEELVARRVAGEPLEQIVGWVDFARMRLGVVPGVFVPRQRTRQLAERTVLAISQMTHHSAERGELGRSVSSEPVVVEAFCGVGPVGSFVAERVPGVDLHLGDSDVDAVECAVGNAQTAGQSDLRIELTASGSEAGSGTAVVSGHRLDCLQGLPEKLRHRVDVIAAVPPYVPTAAADFLPHEAVDFEPSTALFGGIDGLDLVRRLITEAGDWLADDGVLLIELGREQGDDALTYAAAHGLEGQSHLGEGDRLEDEDDAGEGAGEAEHDVDGHTAVLELRRAR